MKIILGSSSPRRKEILGRLFKDFEIIRPEVNEDALPGEDPLKFVRRISDEKSENILSQISDEAPLPCLVITCDTIVTIDNMIIGKPADSNDAREKLMSLSGRTHLVMSGLTLSALSGHSESNSTSKIPIRRCTDVEITGVDFRKLSNDIISDYLGRVNCMDKAGAYAIQEHGEMIVEQIKGSLSNVIGFPLRLFFRQIYELNLTELFTSL